MLQFHLPAKARGLRVQDPLLHERPDDTIMCAAREHRYLYLLSLVQTASNKGKTRAWLKATIWLTMEKDALGAIGNTLYGVRVGRDSAINPRGAPLCGHGKLASRRTAVQGPSKG